MRSTCDLLKQEAASHIKSIDIIVTHLQDIYRETGDESAKMALESLRGCIRNVSFLKSPATGKNLQNDGKRKIVGPPDSKGVNFVDRVKAIMCNAAMKNGQLINSNARGHAGVYTFYVDFEAFCAGMDKLQSVHEGELKEYLGGTNRNVQVTKVCHFIGHVVRMRVINDSSLQLSDLAFAFEEYYGNKETVKRKLSSKSLSPQEKEFFAFFEGILKGAKRQLEAKRKFE